MILRRRPEAFEHDLVVLLVYHKCCLTPRAKAAGARFVLVNAWNEWAEGMVLEPSAQWGYSYLEALLRAKAIAREVRCEDPDFKRHVQEPRRKSGGVRANTGTRGGQRGNTAEKEEDTRVVRGKRRRTAGGTAEKRENHVKHGAG